MKASIVAALLAFGAAATSAANTVSRPATIDDFLRLSDIATVRPSPDGALLTVEVRRPRLNQEPHVAGDELGFERTDLWLVDVASGKKRPLTSGAVTGSWSWAALWSPNGRKLAFLTYTPGQLIKWTIWDRDDDVILTIAHDGSVDLGVNFGSSGPGSSEGIVAGAWIDNERLLTVLMPADDVDAPFGAGVDLELTEPSRQMAKLWEPSERGGVSVTVWDSVDPQVCGARQELTRLDINSSASEALMRGPIRAVSLHGPQAAVISATTPFDFPADQPIAKTPLAWNRYNREPDTQSELRLVNVLDGSIQGPLAGVDALAFIAARRLPRWAHDGGHFAIPARTREGSNKVYWIRTADLAMQTLPADSAFDAEVLSELLALTDGSPSEYQRLAGRRRYPDGEPRRGRIPGDVIKLSGRRIGVFLNDRLTILDRYGHVSGEIKGARQLSDLERILPPHSSATSVASIPQRHTVIFKADTDDGTFLWICERGKAQTKPVLAVNEYLKLIARPQRIVIRFRSASGDLRRALLLAPQGYDPSIRYPMVVDGYPAVSITDSTDKEASLSYYYQHRHILVSAGYLVLIPTVPWPTNAHDDPIDVVTRPVMEAVDAAVAQGFADPSRLGFVGHSYGGYMALALAAKTDRFRAIISMANYSELISHHDTASPRNRLTTCGPSLHRMHAGEMEEDGGLWRMPGPPLEAIERYMRNSPYFQAKSMHTPILLIHGDQDGVPDRNSEMMFFALRRQGVPVQFAHYWGETHSFRSPGNIRDSTNRIIAWLDSHLRQ